MRTMLRSKVTLLFVMCAVAIFAVSGTAMALVTDPSGTTTAASPTIQSDQADYPPGGLVTLTGSNWQPGEAVHINVNDTYGASWTRNVDVTADASGNITDSFNLPDWFVSDYDVTATGAQSGTVRTTFTDSQPNNVGGVSVASPTSATVVQGNSATYGNVSVDMVGNSNTCTVTLGVATPSGDTGLPSGATASFGNSPFDATNVDFTSSLSVNTMGTTAPGTYTFHVKASRGSNCQGNGEVISTQQLTLVVNSADSTAPTSTASATVPDGDDAGTDPDPYTGGTSWTNKDVTVTLNATDNAGGSGVKELTYSATGADPISPAVTKAAADLPTSFTIDAEGTTTISYFAKDNNGNVETAKTFVVNIDKTKPVISATATVPDGPDAGTDPDPYTAGTWTNKDVTVSFSCEDQSTLSGIASNTVAGGTTLSSSGANQSVTNTGTCTDFAGNVADSKTFNDIDIDKDPPTNITFQGGGLTDGDSYNFGSVPAAPTGCTADDTLSLLKSCSTDAATKYSTAVGTHTITATAEDNAGNKATKTLTYTVDPWDATGFYSPVGTDHSVFVQPPDTLPTVNDTGYWNTVKGGSTVPLKFNLFVGGTEKTTTSGIALQAQKLSKCESDGTAVGDPVDFTTTETTNLRYSGTPGVDGQFIQNWKTSKVTAETCYRTAVTFADGSSIYAFFKLLK